MQETSLRIVYFWNATLYFCVRVHSFASLRNTKSPTKSLVWTRLQNRLYIFSIYIVTQNKWKTWNYVRIGHKIRWYYISTMKVCFVCTCHINIIKQLRNSIINLTSLLVFILSRPFTARTGKPRPLLHIIDVFKLSQNQYQRVILTEHFPVMNFWHSHRSK
jgi:hypothetical protein